MDTLTALYRRTGRRSLGTALFIAAVLLLAIYNRDLTSSWRSTTFRAYNKPASPEQSAASSSAEPLSSPSPSASSEGGETVTAQPTILPEPTNPPLAEPTAPPVEPSSCPLIKVSMLYGAHKFQQLEDALETHRRHCERWSCDFVSLEQDIATSRRLFSKQYFLISTLLNELAKPADQRKQWLMWVDADAILINPAISACAFLPPENLQNVYALVTADHQGLNAGVFYLKVSGESLEFLIQTVDYPMVHPEDDLGWFGEQAAMAKVIDSIEARSKAQGTASGIAWVPRFWFNTYEFEHGFEGEPGHHIVHFAGLGATRLSQMSTWLAELSGNQAKWEIPLEETFYADDIPRFWDEFAANTTKV